MCNFYKLTCTATCDKLSENYGQHSSDGGKGDMTKSLQDEENSKAELVAEIAQLKEQVAELRAAWKSEVTLDAAYFRMRLEDEVVRSTRHKHEFSMLLAMLDNLDSYARKYGRESFGEVVSMLSTIIRDTFRKTDIYCQFEPCKYGIILPYTNIEGALVAAEKFRQRVERVFTLMSSSAEINLTMSVGVVTYPGDANSSEQLWQAADEMLSKAKAEGGNCIWSETTANKYSWLPKDTREISSQNHLLLQAISEAAIRCSRFGHKFSLILIALGGHVIEKAKADNQLRMSIMQSALRLISITIRNVDKSYFYQQNKFAVLLPNVDSRDARIVAEKLIKRLTESQIVKDVGENEGITVNIGLGCFPLDDLSKEGLVRRVETALYNSIRDGNKKIVPATSFLEQIGEGQLGLSALISTLKEAGPDAAYNLLVVVDLIEKYGKPHSQAVARYALAIGRAMNLSSVANRQLRIAALMHDLGKICIPKEIVTKPGPLNSGEWEFMRKHPQYGAKVLEVIPGFSSYPPVILSHHERWDGKGYPKGLKGNQIPLESQIIAVAEAYDDMITPRPYKHNISFQAAIAELKRNADTQFNPSIIDIFIKIADKLT
jgi:diguanylate cyclase (GGDEF)-like protein